MEYKRKSLERKQKIELVLVQRENLSTFIKKRKKDIFYLSVGIILGSLMTLFLAYVILGVITFSIGYVVGNIRKGQENNRETETLEEEI